MGALAVADVRSACPPKAIVCAVVGLIGVSISLNGCLWLLAENVFYLKDGLSHWG